MVRCRCDPEARWSPLPRIPPADVDPTHRGPGDATTPGRELVRRAVKAGQHALDEREAKTLLSAYGIPTPAGTVAHSAQDAARAVVALRARAVLKGLGPDIQHKSD